MKSGQKTWTGTTLKRKGKKPTCFKKMNRFINN